MKMIDEIKALQKSIRLASKKIGKLQAKCRHDRIRLKGFPDINAGWGESKSCLDCGKQMGCSTRTRYEEDRPYNRIVRKNTPRKAVRK